MKRLILVLLLLLASGAGARAASDYAGKSINELKAERDRISRLAQEKAAAAAEEADVAAAAEKKVKELTKNITATQNQITATANKIADTEATIGDLENQIAARQQDIDRKIQYMEATMRRYFKMQVTREHIGSVGLAFSTEGISQKIRELQAFESVKRELGRQRDELAVVKQSLEEDKRGQEQKREELAGYKTQQEIQRQNLAAQQAQQSALEKDAEAAYAQLKKEEKAALAEEYRVEAAITAKIQAQLRANGPRFSGQGTPVSQGGVIGYMGSTGFSTGPHVHFTVFTPEGATVNPRTRLGGAYIWPVGDYYVSQEYGPAGWRNPVYTFHNGIDLAGPSGQPVYAAADGKIVLDEYYGGYGNAVVIEHADGWLTLYGHMQ